MTQPSGPPRRYRSLSAHLRQRFGAAVRSVSVDAGFTCPNVDGTVTTGGCVYCDNRSFSPNRRLPRSTVRAQVERGVQILSHRYAAERFIAYFQAATNTHAAVEKLRRLYDEAIDHPLVIGLAIGTRPDSVPDEVLDLLDEYARRLPVWLELGLQTIHDRSLDWMNRGHHFDAFLDAVARCRGRGFELSTHVILGLPGESHADMMATADALASLPISSVKVHNLHAVTGTPLADMVERGEVRLLERDEYVGLICDFLERLPPEMVIHRLQGEAPPEFLVGPKWCLEKGHLLAAIDAELERRDSRQGAKWMPSEGHADRTARRMSLPMISA
jgi:uncharacterized protein